VAALVPAIPTGTSQSVDNRKRLVTKVRSISKYSSPVADYKVNTLDESSDFGGILGTNYTIGPNVRFPGNVPASRKILIE